LLIKNGIKFIINNLIKFLLKFYYTEKKNRIDRMENIKLHSGVLFLAKLRFAKNCKYGVCKYVAFN